MKKILGLDLGTTSIGWALVNEAESPEEESSIIKIGVRVNPLTVDEKNNFEKGKTITTNADRTLKRGMRRNLQRFKQRRLNLTACLIRNKFITAETILSENGNKTLFETHRLRAKAANEEISLEEFARVLLMINKKRGYKSNRKANDAEDGQAFDGISVAEILYNKGITPGQYSLSLLQEGKKYTPEFYKSDIQDELNQILLKQTEFYPEILTPDFLNSLEGKEKGAVKNRFKAIGILSADIKGKERKLQSLKLRVQALKEKIQIEEVAFIVELLSGIINNSSKLLGSISDRSKELYFGKMTIGEYLMKKLDADPHFSIKNHTFFRKDYVDEFEKIWETQSKFHPELNQELRKKIAKIIFFQRPLKSQKGLISVCELEHRKIETMEAGKVISRIVGPKVCPKSSPIYQEFKIWQKLNDIRISDKNEGTEYELTIEQKQRLAEELSVKEKLTKSQVIRILFGKDKSKDMNFNDIPGNTTSAQLFKAYENIMEMTGHEQKFDKLSGKQIIDFVTKVFHALGYNTSILSLGTDVNGKNLEKEPLYKIWHLLYSYEGDNSATGNDGLVNKIMEIYQFDYIDLAKEIAKINFKPEYGSLSAKAISKILPFMKEGKKYSDACAEAGYNHSEKSLNKEQIENKQLIDKLELLQKNSLRNPVVEKILNQMINVVNSVIENYGKPDEIRVEMARELKKTAKEREEMTSSINQSKQDHEKYAEIIKRDFGFAYVSRNDIMRYKLYMELKDNGFHTLYSGTYIPYDQLFSNSFDIEHIIPKAKLYDDSFANKTLEARSVNLTKSDKTAFDFVKEVYPNRIDEYKAIIADLHKRGVIGKRKRDYLLMEEKDIPSDFLNRELNDTRYIAKKAIDILSQIVKVVIPTTGAITDRLREDWQLIDIMKELNFHKYEAAGLVEVFTDHNGKPIKKIKDWTKRNDHRHHAMDALTIAFTKHEYIQYLNNLNARSDKSSSIYAIEKKELERRPDGKIVFKAPMKNFRQEAKKQLEATLVSVKSKTKVTTKHKNKPKKKNAQDSPTVQSVLTPRGPLHNETVYGTRKQYMLKTEKVGASFTRDKIAQVAKKVYREALLTRLEEFDGDPKKAFTGKNALEKKPIWLDSNQTFHVPSKVEVLYMETIYTVRKPISKDLKIEKVLDAGIRRILQDRINEYKGDAAKAFANLDENPIWLNKEKGIAIKSVTINAGLKDPEPIRTKRDKEGKRILDNNGMPIPSDFVQTAGNHHIAIFEDEDGKLQEHVVSFYEATARQIQGLPVVDKDYNKENGWKFLFTLKQNEMFVFPSDDFSPEEINLMDPDNYEVISKHLYRVQKLSSKYYVFRHHLETNVEDINELRNMAWIRIQNVEPLRNIIKVRINNIGQIVCIGEY